VFTSDLLELQRLPIQALCSSVHGLHQAIEYAGSCGLHDTGCDGRDCSVGRFNVDYSFYLQTTAQSWSSFLGWRDDNTLLGSGPDGGLKTFYLVSEGKELSQFLPVSTFCSPPGAPRMIGSLWAVLIKKPRFRSWICAKMVRALTIVAGHKNILAVCEGCLRRRAGMC
jgi:hypothetical protein